MPQYDNRQDDLAGATTRLNNSMDIHETLADRF